MGSALQIMWSLPDCPVSDEDHVLCFLSPREEVLLEDIRRERIIFGREKSIEIRVKAVKLYTEIVAQMGVTRCGAETFRSKLFKKKSGNSWHYHPVPFKDCETSRIFDLILQILTIELVATENDASELILYSPPRNLSEVLKSKYLVRKNSEKLNSEFFFLVWTLIRGLISRVRYLFKWITNSGAFSRIKPPSSQDVPVDIAFIGFWNWSFDVRNNSDEIKDNYFKKLPKELEKLGKRKNIWIASFEEDSGPCADSALSKLSLLRGRKDIFLINSFLSITDIILEIFDLYPLFLYLNTRRTNEFIKPFIVFDLNFFPIFRQELLSGFASSFIPQQHLTALGVSKILKITRPKVIVGFLEHFPSSRAVAYSAEKTENHIPYFVIQHASYNSEKTFLFLHPELEYFGKPDGHRVPTPEINFLMGNYAKELFMSCGYEDSKLIVTGSPRYDYLSETIGNIHNEKSKNNQCMKEGRCKIVTVFASLCDAVELDMLEAVVAASKDLSSIKIRVRLHPFSKITNNELFNSLSQFFTISDLSLQSDITYSDLIIFTYSTTAEEAFIQGKKVWQWLPMGFNGSALGDVASIPTFATVVGLREALLNIDNYLKADDEIVIKNVKDMLFFRGDGKEASRIAEIISSNIDKY